ncbi:SusC/RagA family TonB-linked outer membrane protein [Adhaeribacter aerolatus]|uniref:SusC/RagA family TonB-linked outer membrane protein n=2 Tax=Adhaeribacter aerolatus TaxID=670289 RepID=A0A512AUM3_9BACT|nr:SusC/RagA family TonB-linked outer membrane protein [Adhaeribacter aerolatus]
MLACQPLCQAQTLAMGQKKQNNPVTTQNNSATRKVKDVLYDLRVHYKVDILFSDQMVAGYSTSPDVVNLKSSLEANLKAVLKPLGLGFKKAKDGSYFINRHVPAGKALDKPKAAVPLHQTDLKVTDNLAARPITGKVTAETGEPLIGVTVVLKGTTTGTSTDVAGNYSIEVPDNGGTLVYSYIGFLAKEVIVGNAATLNITMAADAKALEEVVVVGYGSQKKSDITGSVASLPKERLEMVPNINIAQAIQGAIPGVMVQNTSAGAVPNQEIMVRGRNSIGANNSPLVVVDGVPYGGNLSDINPNDVESIEVLKDASSAAIYGSRGANGVILVTTKLGKDGSPKISYDGFVSIQKLANLPEYLDGPGFYKFKKDRLTAGVTASEQAVYDAGEWVNWMDHSIRAGISNQHNLAVSGGFGKTSYYISGGVMNVKGIVVNDDYFRGTSRFNIDTKIANWLTIGTRTQLTFSDQSGVAPNMNDIFLANPLAVPYNPDGTLAIIPVKDDPARGNPLQATLFDNKDKSRQVVTNNFAIVDFERFVPGLTFRFNYGLMDRITEANTYRGRNTLDGLVAQGSASLRKDNVNNTVLENILSYNKTLGLHSLFATAVYSIQKDSYNSESTEMGGFPNDLLGWFAGGQADLVKPSFDYTDSRLVSQMLRLNYAYNSRYLLTLTGRRDGFSGFGADSKWGIFPSVALGWNISNEAFFPWKELFNELKLRGSYGLNGNQAVGSYQSMARLAEENYLSGNTTMPGYFPSTLGQEALGWESSRSTNIGLDFGIWGNRVSGVINAFHTNTYDLLLHRSISSVHGITSILQNIGETENQGVEFSLNTRNISTKKFTWSTFGNIGYVHNKIVDLYGNGLDDINNKWFIGQPIRVNYDYVFDGVWQLDEAAKAAEWKTKPGYIKIKDLNGDGKITPDDRQIIGQQDPKLNWGLTNTFSYGNFSLTAFIHGVHGVTKQNILMDDQVVTSGVRQSTIVKNWWTPDNPSNEWYMNHVDANRMAGVTTNIYENASFVRLKDITLAYDLPKNLIQKVGGNRFRVYATGRNLLMLTDWRGMDPELDNQRSIPLQREYVFGLQVGL